jgi:hypothetical protein
MLLVALVARALMRNTPKPAYRWLGGWLPMGVIVAITAMLFHDTGSETGYIASVVVGLVVVVFAIAVIAGGAYPGAAVFAATFAGANLIAIIAAVGVIFLDRRGRPALARWVISIAAICALPFFATILTPAFAVIGRAETMAVFLFLALLPLLNAVFDTLSYALTLALMRRGLRSRLPLVWGLVDLGLAMGLFLGLGIALVAATHGLNSLADAPIVDLGALFAGIRADPFAYLWLYLMLFSTILPTLLHGVFSLLGVQGIWPRALRRPVARWVEGAARSPADAVRAGAALGIIWTMPLVVLGGILWALWQIGGAGAIWLLGAYGDLLARIAGLAPGP